MPQVLKSFFSSRKFWAFIMGLVTLISTAAEDGAFSAQEIQAIAALIIGYIISVAYEDGQKAKAQATPTTTLETPSTNVTVSTSGTPPVPSTLGSMG